MRKTAATLIMAFLITAAMTTQLVNLANANPYLDLPKFNYVPAPEGTEAPEISIQTPKNNTFQTSNNITLAFKVTIPKTNGDKSIDAVVELYYKTSWKPHETIVIDKQMRIVAFASSISLSDVPDGNQSVTIYVVGKGSYLTGSEIVDNLYKYFYYNSFNRTGSSTVNFTVDTAAPDILFLTLENKTYTAPNVLLGFSVNEAFSQAAYSLDGEDNVTISGNSTVSGLTVGEHNVKIYAWDTVGNVGSSETVTFTVAEPEGVPTAPVAAALAVTIVVVTAGLLLYRRKRKR